MVTRGRGDGVLFFRFPLVSTLHTSKVKPFGCAQAPPTSSFFPFHLPHKGESCNVLTNWLWPGVWGKDVAEAQGGGGRQSIRHRCTWSTQDSSSGSESVDMATSHPYYHRRGTPVAACHRPVVLPIASRPPRMCHVHDGTDIHQTLRI